MALVSTILAAVGFISGNHLWDLNVDPRLTFNREIDMLVVEPGVSYVDHGILFESNRFVGEEHVHSRFTARWGRACAIIDFERFRGSDEIEAELRKKVYPHLGKRLTEQGGARQPATAAESESGEKEKPKPESKRRSQ